MSVISIFLSSKDEIFTLYLYESCYVCILYILFFGEKEGMARKLVFTTAVVAIMTDVAIMFYSIS